MSHSYPSDISREQFARILPVLESARRRTKPRTVDLYDVFCGVLYLLKSGCQWRMLPADFPDWRTCYQYFRQWSERPGPGQDSILEQVLKKSVGAARQSNGRKEQTSCCIVDSQSVKNTDTAGHKGYDAGKKVSGIKRHIAVDTQGLPHAIHVTTADVTDRAGALAMLRPAPRRPQSSAERAGGRGLHRKALCHCGARPVGSLGGSGETQRTAHLRGTAEAMGGGAVFRLAGKVPPTLEELRKEAQYQPANGGACLHGSNPKKIVNRLLDPGSAASWITCGRYRAPCVLRPAGLLRAY